MLAEEELDAADICLPDANHVTPSLDAAKAGKHILLEKPMARTMADCKKIKVACDENGVRILIVHVLRFDPAYNRLNDAVKNGGYYPQTFPRD